MDSQRGNPEPATVTAPEVLKGELKDEGPASIADWVRTCDDHAVHGVHQALVAGTPFVFVTGAAGTGKSTLLKLVAAELSAPPVLAPTGVAALRIGGQTLHSFFRLDKGVQCRGDDGTRRPLDLYRAMSVLIIDEISMVRADVLDKIDWILRQARHSPEPFGGIRVVAFGDLFQLPPVVTTGEKPTLARLGYAGAHFFDSLAAKRSALEVHVLERVHRQRDRAFVEILHGVRRGVLSAAQLHRLNRRVFRESVAQQAGSLVLTTHRWRAEVINEQRLLALHAPEKVYNGAVEGRFGRGELPAPLTLRLRPGARVIWTKNDPDGRWMNGTMGTVLACLNDSVIVDRNDGRAPCTVVPVSWEKCAFAFDREKQAVTRRVVGRYRQLPLSLGWAATVHRSQGITLDRVHVDLGSGAFAPGQAYVALSRSRTERGLTLARPIDLSDLIVDQRVITFLQERTRRAAA